MTNPSFTTMIDAIALMAAAEERALQLALQPSGVTPSFAAVPPPALEIPSRMPDPVFDEKAEQQNLETKSLDCAPASTAVPISLSIDDASVQVDLLRIVPRDNRPRSTLVNTPSLVDDDMVARRLRQLDQVMNELESTSGFWTNAELLLQDSWLNGYRATFFEQKGCIVEATESYKRALKLYALALKHDRLTAKSSPHIISYYYLLKRYADVLSDAALPAELYDAKTIHRIHEQMEIIRADRQKWGMTNPESEDEPFSYPGTILKVLCL